MDQLVAVSGMPIKKLGTEKEANLAKVEALSSLGTTLTDLKDAVQAIRADEIFSARTVSSDVANTTWKSSSVTGAAIGSYAFDVTQLATQAQLRGASDIGGGLAPTSDVSGVTVANLATATAITAGTFTVDGKQVTIATTDSLKNVFDAINNATGGTNGVGGDVTATYDPATDRIRLTKASGTELVLGHGHRHEQFSRGDEAGEQRRPDGDEFESTRIGEGHGRPGERWTPNGHHGRGWQRQWARFPSMALRSLSTRTRTR